MTHDGLEWDLQLYQQEQGISGLVPYFSHARRVKMNRFAKNLLSSISMIQVALVCFSVVVVSGSPVLAQNGPSASAVEIFQSIDRAGLSGPVLRIQPARMSWKEARWVKKEVKATLRAMAQSCDEGDAETFLYHIAVTDFSGFFPALLKRMRDRGMDNDELMTYLCEAQDNEITPTDTRAGKCLREGCTDVQFRGRNLIPTMGEDGVVRFVGLGKCALDVCQWPVAATRRAYLKDLRGKRMASRF